MADEVKIVFGADTAQLKAAAADVTAALKNSKAGFDGAAISAKDFAAALAASGNDIAKAVKLADAQTASVTAAAAAIKTETQALGAMPGALNAASAGAESAAKAHDHLSMSTVGAKREMIVLAHEMVQGNYSRLGGSLMVLAERMGGLSGLAMIAAAAIGGLGYAAYEIIKNITEADASIRGLQNTMANMGRSQASLNLTDGQAFDSLKHQITDLSNTMGISKADAGEVSKAIEGIGTASNKTRTNLKLLAPAMAVLSDQEPAKAAETLAGAFKSFGGLDQLATQLNLFGVAERKAFDSAQYNGKLLDAQAIAVHALQERYSEALPWVKQWNESQQTLSNVSKPKGSAPTGDAPDQSGVQQYQQDQKRLVADTRQNLADIEANWTKSRSEFATLAAQTWSGVVASHKLANAQELEAERELNRAKLAERKAADAEEKAQDAAHLAQMEASGTMTRAQILSAEIADSQKELSHFQGTADEKLALERQTNQMLAKLHAEQIAETRRGLQEGVAAAKAGSSERIAAETELYAFEVKNEGERGPHAKAAWDSIIATTNQAVAQMQAIEQRRQQTARDVANVELQAQQDSLEAQVQAGEITVQEKIAQMRVITDATYDQNIAQLQSDISRYHEGEKEYEEYAGKLAVAAAQIQRDHAKSDMEMAAADKASADASANAWAQAVSPVQRAWDGAMQGIFMGTQTISQAFARMGANMALSFAEAIVSMMAKWVAFQAAQAFGWTGIAASIQQSMNTGTFAWVMGENAKTAATMSGNAARTASDTASESSFIGKIATRIAAWLGFETSKTAATVAGSAADATADNSSTADAVVSAKLEAAGTIPTLAGEAAAGAYAATAAIPVVGPEAAPAAAATAYADTMAFLGVASAAGGMGSVPRDGMMFKLHEEEMVLPKYLANPLRSALTGASPSVPNFNPANSNTPGRAGAGGGAGGNITINNNLQALDQAGMANLLTRSGNSLVTTIQQQLSMGARLAPGSH